MAKNSSSHLAPDIEFNPAVGVEAGCEADKKEALAVGTFGAVRVLRYYYCIKRDEKCQE